LTLIHNLIYNLINPGGGEKPERSENGRPLEPDTGNAGVGKGYCQPYSSGIRFFCFMRLIINGIEHNSVKANTVSELLKELGIKAQGIAVEINRQIVKKTSYSEYPLKDGDTIEIINFVGGG